MLVLKGVARRRRWRRGLTKGVLSFYEGVLMSHQSPFPSEMRPCVVGVVCSVGTRENESPIRGQATDATS